MFVDAKGRIVIPQYMRVDLGIEKESYVYLEKYLLEGDNKALFIKKA